MSERRIKYCTLDGVAVDVSLKDFSIDQRQERTKAELTVIMDIHANSGNSHSWLRRLTHELEKLDLSVSDRELVRAICRISHKHETWDSLVEAIKEIAKGGGDDQSQRTAKED